MAAAAAALRHAPELQKLPYSAGPAPEALVETRSYPEVAPLVTVCWSSEE